MVTSETEDRTGRDRQAGTPPRLSLRMLVRTVVAVLAGLLLAISAATVIARIQVTGAQSQLRGELIPAQTAAEQLAKAYVDEETGQRGYLLTGQLVFLQPYHSGRIQAAALQAELRSRLADDLPARRLLAQVIEAEHRWLTQAAEPEIAARQRGPIPAAAALRLAETGKRLFDALRVGLARLQARTTALTTSQLNRMSAAQLVANVVTAVAVILALVVTGLGLILLRRYVDHPLGRLVAQVRAVADGDYDRPISISGPTEITAMAQAVASMRASIVHNSDALLQARHTLTLSEERERLAADLRDLTIQRVFALGLALTSTATRHPPLASSFRPLIDQTDEIIRELRRVVFEIKDPPRRGGLAAQLGRLLPESERVLGFTPALEVAGHADELVTGDLLVELTAAAREALSTVARHARVTTATVRVAIQDGELHLSVSHDGADPPADAGSGHGLLSLRERAARLGGTAVIGPDDPPGNEPRGTRVDWRVPLLHVRDGPASSPAKAPGPQATSPP